MKTMSYGYVSEVRAEGRAESILVILEDRGIAVSEAERSRIATCTDVETLNRWLIRASSVNSVSDLFDET
ncbi:hypothetical protein GCM10027447_04590 [Glycomyces halotolerans]